MRAIASGQLEGFPPKEELRTVYAEHDIDAKQAETPVVESVYSDPNLQGVDRFNGPSAVQGFQAAASCFQPVDYLSSVETRLTKMRTLRLCACCAAVLQCPEACSMW